MNQYILEQSVLYLAKLKRQGLADVDGGRQREAQPQRWFHLAAMIARWLQSALHGNVLYIRRRRGEGWH
jgi:hypothetical protein